MSVAEAWSEDVPSGLDPAAVHPSWSAAADLPCALAELLPAPGRVVTPSGRTLSVAAARRVRLATPFNTRRGRESRSNLFPSWCREHGQVATDPGTVPDYLAHLADRGHLPETLETYAGTLAHGLALSGHPLDAEDRSMRRGHVRHLQRLGTLGM